MWFTKALASVHRKLDLVLKEQRAMSENLDRVLASVAAENTQLAKLEALTTGLSEQIRSSASDPAALSALADSIDAQTAEIAASVASASAPAVPTPAPAAEPTPAPLVTPAPDAGTTPVPDPGATPAQ